MIWNCLLRSAAWEAPRWLCEPHLAERRDQRDDAGNHRWLAVEQLMGPWPAWLFCDDCERDRQAAPGYAAPAADVVSTRPESRLLTRAELARIEMPAPLHPRRPTRRKPNPGGQPCST